MKTIKSAVLSACMLLICSVAGAQQINTLIVTGQNNHNWQVSHQALRMILQQTGAYRVDVAITPAAGGDMSVFKPEFSKYDLVVLDYNGDGWWPETKENFLSYVRNGGGLIVYHAADNAFSNWEEFNRIIALGGWDNRNEKSGPYCYYENGKLVKDFSKGNGGNHGAPREYNMHCRNKLHPVTRGLPDNWLHGMDELYDSMRGPGNIDKLLYTAKSDISTGGSGREEPLVFTVKYGKSRIFHIMTGHCGPTLLDNPAMQCAGFQTLFLRGAEWAATGKVTQKVPDDFPTAGKTSFRIDYKYVQDRDTQDDEFVFVQMSDPQIGFMDESENFHVSDSLMQSAVNAINLIRPSCVIVTGDLLHNRRDEEQRSIYNRRMSEINPDIPVFITPGNHDMSDFNKENLAEYIYHVGYDRFSFNMNGCAFIGFDSCRIKSDDTAAEQEQFGWLEAQLKKAEGADHIFLFCHCPLVHKSLDEEMNYNSFPVELRGKYLSLFKKYGVEILFSGHTHTGITLDMDGITSVNIGPVAKAFNNRISGINVVTVDKNGTHCEFLQGGDVMEKLANR